MFPASMPDSGLVPSARPRTRSDRASQQGSGPHPGRLEHASSPLIANLQSASRVGLQATATPAAATPQNDTPQARAPEPSVARGVRCAGGPIALEIVSDCGQPVSSEPWLAFPSGLEAAIRSEVR